MQQQKSENAYMISSFIDIAVNYPKVIKSLFTLESEQELSIKLQIDG
jgi:hypothetical protein